MGEALCLPDSVLAVASMAAKNEDRRTAVLFCRSARPRTPFFGGTIDDKKGMRGHRMGCQN